MKCDKCGNEAVIFQQYSGRHLCGVHLVADVESRIKRDVRAGRWMRQGDHLAVALSGSRSSRALLSFFHKLTMCRKDIRFSAIVIEEGIPGHRSLPEITELADTLGIPCYCGSIKHDLRRAVNDNSGSPCNRCRQLRHTLIEAIARREGITRILSGKTLEDQTAGILMNVLLGKVENLMSVTDRTERIEWINPLESIPREEAELYADILCPGGKTMPCPYRETGFFEEVRDVLETYTLRHPSTPYSVAGIGRAIRGGRMPDCRNSEGGPSA